jgi:MFS family permease
VTRVERTPRWFYGWNVVGAALLSQAVAFGATIYSYGVFITPLALEFQASRFATLMGMAVFNAAMSLTSPFIGHALDTRSVRAVMISGALLLGGGFVAMAHATALWQVGIAYASAVAIGATMMGPLAGATLAANWFHLRRGRALGIAAMGTSIGGFLIPPAAAFLIVTLGWRNAFQILGVAVVLMTIPPLWMIVVNRPEHRGSWPDGIPPEADELRDSPNPVQTEWTTRAILGQRSFWVITISVGLLVTGFSAVMANLVPLAEDQGIGAQQASYLMSCLAGFGVLGKLSFGAAADRIDKRTALWMAIGLAAGSIALLLGSPSYTRLLVASAGFGLASGGLLPVWGALIGLGFGRDAFGRVMGLMSPIMLPIVLPGAPLAGWIFDQTGSYTTAFQIFLVGFGLSAATLGLLRLPGAGARA